jgi:signal transduction histidine kinase
VRTTQQPHTPGRKLLQRSGPLEHEDERTMSEKPKILYIEDNYDNQRLVQRVLGARGYRVVVAEDGISGLALARESRPILILVDINIPGLSGYETTTRLRSQPHLSNTPIVALTADITPGARERALVAGCDGYISKPIDTRALPRQIAEYIAGERDEVSPSVETNVLREYNHQVVERLELRVRALMSANAELQEIDRLKDHFLSSLSHELRTPLTSLAGYLDLLRRHTLGELNDMQVGALDIMQRNVDVLSSQLNNLLYLQEHRASQLMLKPVSLAEIVHTVLGTIEGRARDSDIAIDVHIGEMPPLQADPSGLELALTNLLDNAIKYTPPGGRVTLSVEDEPSRVIIRVEDMGYGIPVAVLDKIFLPFYRLDDSLASQQPGSGVGLALVKHVAEAHGGQVTVRSVLECGSTFTLMLPRQQS